MSNYVGQRPILFAEPRTELTKGDIYKLSRNYYLALGKFFWMPLTAMDPTTAIFDLCTHKGGIFALVGDPLQSH